MCGIAGWYEQQPPADNAPLQSMLAAMAARGPDDRGTAEIRARAGGCWNLGACRLAILDLSPAGHQPMRDAETGNWLAYNGEIYNFRELRAELESRGCVFRSRCDTEVLLLGYRIWGEEVLSRLRGMFAFAVWDEHDQSLLLARDRHGIKPLYYAQAAGRFLFASELRALLASGLIARELDPTGLDSLLKFGAVQEPSTLVRGVRLLAAGHVLRWKVAGTALRRYWSLPAPEPARNGSARERERRVEELRGALSDAVRLRLVSDVPLGVFLSGGLDSSCVTALAARGGSPIRTFNINFAEERYAEGEKARRVAAHVGAEHTEITVTENDLLAALPEALTAMDQPTVDGVNTWFVSRAAKQSGVTVALSGLGGDELFAGYRSFRVVPRLERAARWLPQWSRPLAAGLLDSRRPSSAANKLALWLRNDYGFDHPFFLSRQLFAPRRVARLLAPEQLLALDFSVFADEFAEFRRLLAAHDAVNRVSCLELGVYLRNTLLRDTDCMSMAHSLEVRVPLIDHVVTELALRMPGAWKLDPAQAKPLLAAALKEPLPEEILRQPKRGFEFPWAVWMRGRLRTEIEQALSDPGPLAAALEWSAVQQVWREFLDGQIHWSRPWLLYTLRQWAGRHLRA